MGKPFPLHPKPDAQVRRRLLAWLDMQQKCALCASLYCGFDALKMNAPTGFQGPHRRTLIVRLLAAVGRGQQSQPCWRNVWATCRGSRTSCRSDFYKVNPASCRERKTMLRFFAKPISTRPDIHLCTVQ